MAKSKQDDEKDGLKNEIAQLKRQLAVKALESAGTNLGAIWVEGHRMTGNGFMLSALDASADK